MKKTSLLHAIMWCTLLAAAFTACEKGAHDNEYPLGNGEGAFVVGLASDQPVDHLNLFLFKTDGNTAIHKEYGDPRALASEYHPVAAASYTVVAVANVPDDDLAGNTTVADLAAWLNDHTSDYPTMRTASTQTAVAAGEVKRLQLTLQNSAAGISIATLPLRLTLPDTEMPDYVTRGWSDERHSLRLVAEAYLKGSGTRVFHHSQLCTPQPDGTCTVSIDLLPNEYDLRLWVDRTAAGSTDDTYYYTDDLSAVTVRTDGYAANDLTDEKDAAYATLSVRVGEENPEQPVTLIRPFARYRIVATDVEGYLNLIAEGKDLPPIDDLQVRVSYEGFLPTAFNVATGKATDALQGIFYETGIAAAEGYPEDEARQAGADFVLTGDDDSFVTVTVETLDRATGKAVSTVRSVKIPYRRGELTTVTGAFLTAGRISGGVTIDTSWGEDDIVIDF